jgi:hypothetical protein
MKKMYGVNYKTFMEVLTECYAYNDPYIKGFVLSSLPRINKNFIIYSDVDRTRIGNVIITVMDENREYFTVTFLNGDAKRTLYVKRQNGKKVRVFEL